MQVDLKTASVAALQIKVDLKTASVAALQIQVDLKTASVAALQIQVVDYLFLSSAFPLVHVETSKVLLLRSNSLLTVDRKMATLCWNL